MNNTEPAQQNLWVRIQRYTKCCLRVSTRWLALTTVLLLLSAAALFLLSQFSPSLFWPLPDIVMPLALEVVAVYVMVSVVNSYINRRKIVSTLNYIIPIFMILCLPLFFYYHLRIDWKPSTLLDLSIVWAPRIMELTGGLIFLVAFSCAICDMRREIIEENSKVIQFCIICPIVIIRELLIRGFQWIWQQIKRR